MKKQKLLILSCFILTLLLNSCLSTKKVTREIKAYDNSLVKSQSAISELPAGINLNLQNPLPDSTSVRKSYFMVLPLVFINYFQTNHKLTLGQSSLETPISELFKSEFLRNLNIVQWNELYQNGYSIDIDVNEMTSTGVFASGFIFVVAAAMEAGTAAGGKISHSKRLQSLVHISLNLNRNDSLLVHRDFDLLVKANDMGKLKLAYTDSQTGETVSKPSLPNLVSGHSFELLIPSTREIFGICIKMACGRIDNIIENFFFEFCNTSMIPTF